jgi:hypothetical protein
MPVAPVAPETTARVGPVSDGISPFPAERTRPPFLTQGHAGFSPAGLVTLGPDELLRPGRARARFRDRLTSPTARLPRVETERGELAAAYYWLANMVETDAVAAIQGRPRYGFRPGPLRWVTTQLRGPNREPLRE